MYNCPESENIKKGHLRELKVENELEEFLSTLLGQLLTFTEVADLQKAADFQVNKMVVHVFA